MGSDLKEKKKSIRKNDPALGAIFW